MPTISEPSLEANQWTYNRVRKAFIAGVIGEATFRVSLRHLGLAPCDIECEVALALREKRNAP